MSARSASPLVAKLRRFAVQARRPEWLAFLPAITLASFWLGGETLLLSVALGLPLLFALCGVFGETRLEPVITAVDGVTGLVLRDAVLGTLDEALVRAPATGRSSCCFVVTLDDAGQLAEQHGHAAMALIQRRIGERLKSAVRENDVVARLDGANFGVALSAVRRVDLESSLQLAARLQSACEQPISIDAISIYVSCSVGFCLASRTPVATGAAMLQAAETAASDARRNGPGAIRSFTAEMQKAQDDQHILRQEIESALDTGQIVAYFQPQVSTNTGEVTGFEALARWDHPTRGLMQPAEFLTELRQAGLSERLSEKMLVHALTALRDWEKAGLGVPTVAVNFSSDELRNPRLADKLKWELDRFDLVPARLTVEILETVVADTDNDVIVRSIAAMAALGCGIDLDDFGTGHASIANIRRFAVSRIKIDRSFVSRVDEDREQQKMVAAILSMAERLGLDTLAEGVETIGEHAMLAQLGCGHVQGFGLSRPMPFADTIPWLQRHQAKLAKTPRMSRLGGH